jgi:hypothetical protein
VLERVTRWRLTLPQARFGEGSEEMSGRKHALLLFYIINEWIHLRWERGTRYYEVYLHQDLWGDWVLTQVWGRRGTALYQVAIHGVKKI